MQSNSYVTKVTKIRYLFKKNKVPLLSWLDIELTERCNNNCIHCCINLPQDDLEAENKELSTEEIKEILKEAASLGCMKVRFTGGEPLIREDFEELYIFARKIGLKVLLFTNATLINEHMAVLFSLTPPLEKIEVSLYGMKKESYQAVTRTPGSFAAAWGGISLLLEKRVPFVVKGVRLPSNKDEIEDFEKWTLNIPWMNKPSTYAISFDLRCRRDCQDKNQLIKGLRLSTAEGLKILTRRNDRYIKEMKEFCSRFMRIEGDRLFPCGAGHGGGCVDAYGYFQLCMMLRHPDTVYDLRNGSLKEALINFFPKIREMKATNSEYLKRCARCFLKGLCEQCPAKSWMEYGTLDTPVEYFCQIAHVKARRLGLLQEKEMGWEVEDWRERIKEFTGMVLSRTMHNQ